MTKLDLVAFGAANTDLLMYLDEFPKPDQETNIKNLETLAGGSGANVAVGVNRLGKKTGFVGKVGNDNFGKFLIEEFNKEGVDISNLKIEEGNSTLVMAIVDKNGQRILLLNPGVQSTLSKEDVPKDYIQNSNFLFIHSVVGENVIEAIELAAKYAKEAGVKVLFDPGFIFAKMGIEKFKKILECTDILKLNEEEIKVFTNLTDIEESFKMIRSYGPKYIIVTHGKDGCIFSCETMTKKIPVPINVNPIDTTGAGDAFSSALIAALLYGKDYYEACSFANLVASISTTKKGARGVPTLDELKNFKV